MADLVVSLGLQDQLDVRAFVDAKLRLKGIQCGRAHASTCELRAYDVAGKLGEVAFARHFGHAVDWRVGPGGDGHADFQLSTGATVDIKSIAVAANLAHDYRLIIGDENSADYFVQVLLAPGYEFALITGGISRRRALARPVDVHWPQRSAVPTRARYRSELSQDYPAAFWSQSSRSSSASGACR